MKKYELVLEGNQLMDSILKDNELNYLFNRGRLNKTNVSAAAAALLGRKKDVYMKEIFTEKLTKKQLTDLIKLVETYKNACVEDLKKNKLDMRKDYYYYNLDENNNTEIEEIEEIENTVEVVEEIKEDTIEFEDGENINVNTVYKAKIIRNNYERIAKSVCNMSKDDFIKYYEDRGFTIKHVKQENVFDYLLKHNANNEAWEYVNTLEDVLNHQEANKRNAENRLNEQQRINRRNKINDLKISMVDILLIDNESTSTKDIDKFYKYLNSNIDEILNFVKAEALKDE